MNKLKNKITTIILAFGLLLVVDANSQNFHMNGGSATYNATCGAVIKLKGVSSQIQTTSNPFGSNLANSIPGVVDWASTVNGQTVQGFYYDHMVISGGGTKTVSDGVYIVGGVCATPLTGYANLATYPFYVETGAGNNTFTGTFHYVGTVAQNIFPIFTSGGGQPNNYNDLDLSGGGTKTVPAGSDVGVAGEISLAAGTQLDILGDLYAGADNSTLNGTVLINNANANLFVGSGSITFNDDVTINQGQLTAAAGAGTVTIGASSDLVINSGGSVSFAGGTNFVITGTIANNGDGTNLIFACTSTQTYNGVQNPQIVLPTISSNPYGTLVLQNGQKRGGDVTGYPDNIYVCNDFSLAGGNFDLVTNSNILYLQAEDATVTYAANEEVVGRMNRVTSTTPSGSYIFNNAQTILTLSNSANNPTSIELNVRPNTNPYNYTATKDVNRKVNMTYTGNAGSFNWTARVGYLESEGPDPDGGGPLPQWGGSYSQTTTRFYENDGVATNDEKVSTGNPYSRLAASGSTLGYLQLAGIGSTATTAVPNGIGVFASTNDLKITAGPTTLITIADGRWTNPNVWDEGIIPTENDSTLLRHMVYVGIDGPFAGTIGGADEVATNNTLREITAYGTNPAALSIRIINDNVNWPNASLIIANEDNGAGYKFKTKGTTGNTFNNENTAAISGVTFPSNLAKGSYTKSNFNGLWLMYGNTNWGISTDIPTFETYQILNLGSINNEGIIEIGQ